MTPLDDDAFLAAVAAGERPAGRFAHEDHLRLAWIVLRRDGCTRGEERLTQLLRNLAASQGAPQRYHETLTRAWSRLVAAAIAGLPDDADFARLVAAHPGLARRDALDRHFSPELLATPEARATWRDPDREPLPPFSGPGRERTDDAAPA